MHLLDEMAEHRLGNLEVRDDAVLERTDGHDITGGAAEHSFCLVANRQDPARSSLHRDDRWFPKDNPVVLYVDERVGRPQINTDVVRKQTEKSIKHSKSPLNRSCDALPSSARREPGASCGAARKRPELRKRAYK
jgi:hypothetical protein